MGRWGGFMKASAHNGLVVVDIAIVQCDCLSTVDEDATSSLPNNKARQKKRAPQWGDGVVSWCKKRSTYILRAHKGATHSTSVKRAPPSGRWGGHGGAFGGVLRNARKSLCSSRSGTTGRSLCPWRCRRHLQTAKQRRDVSESEHPIGAMG